MSNLSMTDSTESIEKYGIQNVIPFGKCALLKLIIGFSIANLMRIVSDYIKFYDTIPEAKAAEQGLVVTESGSS